MATIIKLKPKAVKSGTRIISSGYVAPASKRSHAADHVTENMVVEISEHFISSGKLRDNLLFILGCNCGLRCGELVSLKWGQVITPEGEIREKILFIEEKNSRKEKVDPTTGATIKGITKTREVDVNDAVCEAILLYLDSLSVVDINDYVFKSESRSANYYTQQRKNGIGLKEDHLTRQAVDQMLKKTIKEALGYIDLHVSTHTMRKTFARYVWDNAPESQKNDVARFLQKMLGHASLDSTLHYIGVTQEEMSQTYKKLNLGKRKTSSQIVAIKHAK